MRNLNKQEKYASDLEEALEIAGLGWYNLTLSAVLVMFLMALLIEQIEYSIILPAAACDLKMSSSTRGLVASLSYTGFVLTSYPMGYLVDTRGRKKMLIFGGFIAGIFSVMSAFMPDWISFGICKFISSLCFPCLAAGPYAFVEEIMPTRYRDTIMSLINGMQMVGTVLVPLLAWAILPLNFSIDFGVYMFRPWRLLTIVYASFSIIAAILMCFFPESPKYLVSQDKFDEALKALQIIYARNKGKTLKEFTINKLTEPQNNVNKGSFLTTLREQSAPLHKWMYLKWVLVSWFILFGILSILNGLYIWIPDLINGLVIGREKGKTVCQVYYSKYNETSTGDDKCYDNIDVITLYVNSIAQAGCFWIILLISSTVKYIGKKKILIMVLWFTGTSCILVTFITDEVVITVLLSLLLLSILGFGSVTAYIVEILPTHLRGVTLTICIMLGTLGSIVTSNVSGILINDHCETVFYLFGGLLFLGSAFSFLLPNTGSKRSKYSSKGYTPEVVPLSSSMDLMIES